MKKYYYITTLLLLTNFVFSQVGIGTAEPDNSSILDVVSENKGVLIPRIVLNNNKEQLSNSFENANSLLIYNLGSENGLSSGFYFWNGYEWRMINNTSSTAPKISGLLCNTALLIPSRYTIGVPYLGNLKVYYTNGNGSNYNPGETITVNGLSFKLISNKLEYGNGELVFSVYGTPTISSPNITTIPINNSLIPFLDNSMSCDVSVGDNDDANISQKASIGNLYLNPGELLGGLPVYHRYVTSPDGKFSVRVKIEEGYSFGASDINIRSNVGTPEIMWNNSTEYVPNGHFVYGNNKTTFTKEGEWSGNGGYNGDTFTSGFNSAWGDPDVYYNSPEYRRYTWTTTDTNDKTTYIFTFMLGAPSPTNIANKKNCPDGTCIDTKAYLKIEQVTAP